MESLAIALIYGVMMVGVVILAMLALDWWMNR